MAQGPPSAFWGPRGPCECSGFTPPSSASVLSPKAGAVEVACLSSTHKPFHRENQTSAQTSCNQPHQLESVTLERYKVPFLKDFILFGKIQSSFFKGFYFVPMAE